MVPPSRAEMEEIELSIRFYHEGGAHLMTVPLPSEADSDRPDAAPVACALNDRQVAVLPITIFKRLGWL